MSKFWESLCSNVVHHWLIRKRFLYIYMENVHQLNHYCKHTHGWRRWLWLSVITTNAHVRIEMMSVPLNLLLHPVNNNYLHVGDSLLVQDLGAWPFSQLFLSPCLHLLPLPIPLTQHLPLKPANKHNSVLVTVWIRVHAQSQDTITLSWDWAPNLEIVDQ